MFLIRVIIRFSTFMVIVHARISLLTKEKETWKVTVYDTEYIYVLEDLSITLPDQMSYKEKGTVALERATIFANLKECQLLFVLIFKHSTSPVQSQIAEHVITLRDILVTDKVQRLKLMTNHWNNKLLSNVAATKRFGQGYFCKRHKHLSRNGDRCVTKLLHTHLKCTKIILSAQHHWKIEKPEDSYCSSVASCDRCDMLRYLCTSYHSLIHTSHLLLVINQHQYLQALTTNVLRYNQQYLQKKIYLNLASRIYTTSLDLLSWMHNKLVKPQMTLKYFANSTGLNFNFSNIFHKNIKFRCLSNTLMNIIFVTTNCIFIVSLFYSIEKSTKQWYSFVEKNVWSSGSFSSKNDPYSLEEKAIAELRSLKHLKPSDTNGWVLTAAKFDDSQNHVLPLSLQQQLDAMSPKEYLPYVLKELTLDERESLMIDEAQRRKTFLVSWPYDKDLSGIQMAKAGFYALNDHDRVQCVFCRGSLHRWEPNDIPMSEHKKSFPFCRFVKGMECGNREYRSKKLTDDDMKNITKYGPHSKSSRDSADNVSLGISTNRAATVQYAPDATRLKTFSRWPSHMPVSAKDLCEAGFYYTGFDDQVRCFFCSGGLREWVSGDDPWVEHAKWFPECLYLIHQKGQVYVDQVHERTPDNKKSVRKTQSQKKVEAKKKEQLTMQEEMIIICRKLNYTEEAITMAFHRHGRPFDRINQLIDALYDVEESELPYQDLPTNAAIADVQAVCPENERQTSLNEMVEAGFDRVDGSEVVHKYELGCWNCEARTNHFTRACHIGLPCGHLIFCDKCNVEQERKSKDPQYKVTCPYKQCGANLSASMKVYFA